MAQSKKKARFIKPPNKLKAKVGSGGISPELIKQAQVHINNNITDFDPIAQNYLNEIDVWHVDIEENYNNEDSLEKLTQSIMQLKASGGMFKYQLVSEIADSCMYFIENIEDINDDSLTVIKAHENAIKIIVKKQLKGDGGEEGYKLVKELNKASTRYFKKHNIEL